MIFNDMQQNPLIEGLALKLAAGLDAGSATLGDIPSQLQAGGAKIAAAMSGGGDVNAALSALGTQIAGTGTADRCWCYNVSFKKIYARDCRKLY